MARGKHKARAANRRASAAEVMIDQLTSELDMEQEALATAEGARDQLTGLQADLKSENAALLEQVTPYAEHLRQERDYLRSLLADANSHAARVKAAWDRVMDTAMDVAPGATRLEQLESVFRLIGSNMYLDDQAHLKLKDRSTESITRLQRARGQRRDVAEGRTPEQADREGLEFLLNLGNGGPAVIRPAHRQRLLDEDVVHLDEEGKHHVRVDGLTQEQQETKAAAIRAGHRVAKSTAGDLTADALQVWGSGGLISTDGEPGAVRQALGYTPRPEQPNPTQESPLTVSVTMPLPGLPATSRDAASRQEAERVLDTWRDVFASRREVTARLGIPSHPFAPPARHPQPSHGLAAQSVYALSALSQWASDDQGSVYALVAVGLTAAATYWLPAGQTASFAESDPLDDADRAEMVLPFPQVFLAFAEPLVLEPSTEATTQAEKIWHELSTVAHDSYPKGIAARHITDERAHLDRSPSIDEAISERGAHIEGVLMLADSLGRVQDQFAWCLAIPGDYGSALGRYVIPARRSATEYRALIDNLTAVVAWAQWHEPDESTTVPLGAVGDDLEALVSSADFQRNARRSGSGIRVVDVKSTHRSPAPSAGSGEPESHVAPHIRRGHWRRQRHGSKREQVKRIRIAPVLVNAHRGDIAPRVYRLRRDPQLVAREQ
ncbi:hypothetical protein LG293_17505 (plasmid) [Citricoccus nitrophenolicus]